MCLEKEVFCYKCLGVTAENDAEMLSIQRYVNGEAKGIVKGWVCWFCLHETTVALPICLSSSLYLKKQDTRLFGASEVEDKVLE